jgi:hypothetical protein
MRHGFCGGSHGDLISPMGRAGTHRIVLAALMGVPGCLTLTIVQAGERAWLLHGGGARPAAPGLRGPAGRLDLTLPAVFVADSQKPVESFRSPKRPKGVMDETQAKWANLRSAADGQRIPSRAELLTRNFHRDGLPVAKLFQSQYSLVHIGLNQKGKPGLWFVEKLH